MWLKQSTAVTVKMGPFLDSTDGVTAETALTISQADIRLSKNGGNIAQSNNVAGATHDELGYYDVPLDTTDTGTLGTLRVAIHEAGALPVWQDFMVVPANVWDSLFGADKLQVHAAEISNDLITAAALAADASSEIADAVWDENIVAAHGTADTAGRALRTLDAISDRTNNSNLNALLGVPDTASADVPTVTATEVTTAIITDNTGLGTGDIVAGSPAAILVDAMFAEVVVEGYSTDGNNPTLAQLLHEIRQTAADFSISGTTLTVKKMDGTAAMTFSLDDSNNPTSRTRAT